MSGPAVGYPPNKPCWRQRLEALTLSGPCGILPRFPGLDAADLLTACGHHDVEGIVLKRLRSVYRPGERNPIGER